MERPMTTLIISEPVGKNCPNLPQDVNNVALALIANGKIDPSYVPNGKFDQVISQGIFDTQRHWMAVPDVIISVGGKTQKFMWAWQAKLIAPGVQLPGRLQAAWDLVSPLLPEGSYCSSGYRSEAAQRKILHEFFTDTFKAEIIAKYTREVYNAVSVDLIFYEQKVLEMVRGVGQAIAAPGNSPHQFGKAVDIGGPSSIDQLQVEIVTLVARAHADLFSPNPPLKERTGCVHFEIR
jgi:hypothetical protein